MPKYAQQFTKLQVQINEPRPGFDAYIAVWSAGSAGELVLGAPSMEQLAERWRQVTGLTLDRSRVQHVLMLHCSAPEKLWEQARDFAAQAAQQSEANKDGDSA